MASDVDICNGAIQLLGGLRITSLSDNTVEGRACNARYAIMRDAEITRHPWRFAVDRVTLAPDATAPAFEFTYAFTWPTDCLRPIPGRDVTDWTNEGRKILTNDGDTLQLRYVKRVTDTAQFDPLFVLALEAALALNICEQVTQSNTKKSDARDQYKFALTEAKRVNAIIELSQDPPDDAWVTARR